MGPSGAWLTRRRQLERVLDFTQNVLNFSWEPINTYNSTYPHVFFPRLRRTWPMMPRLSSSSMMLFLASSRRVLYETRAQGQLVAPWLAIFDNGVYYLPEEPAIPFMRSKREGYLPLGDLFCVGSFAPLMLLAYRHCAKSFRRTSSPWRSTLLDIHQLQKSPYFWWINTPLGFARACEELWEPVDHLPTVLKLTHLEVWWPFRDVNLLLSHKLDIGVTVGVTKFEKNIWASE